MSQLPREGPDGRLSSDGSGPPPRRGPLPPIDGTREQLLLLASAASAAATLVQLGWQTDQLASALDGATGDIRILDVSGYIATAWADLVVIGVAVAVLATRRSARWAPVTWGGLLVLAGLRVVAALPQLSARLTMTQPLAPPVWLDTLLAVAGLLTAGLLLGARPHPPPPAPAP